MIRALGFGLALILQLAAALAPAGLVLCVHGDGHWFLESASVPCCRVCPRAEAAPESARGASPGVGGDPDGGEDDDCRDFALGAAEFRAPAAKGGANEARGAQAWCWPAPAFAAACVLPSIAAPGEGNCGTGPPRPGATPSHLRTVVLRC